MIIKKAFTLAETLIVITIIGILAVITMPSLTGSLPDRNKTMFKKAYSIVERTVAEAVNDETLYPFDRERIGFANTDEITIPGANITAKGNTKFCTIFMNKVNVIGEPANPCEFETTDGLSWKLPKADFATGTTAVVTVDVNGTDKQPNKRGEDVFEINVRSDGKISVEEDSTEAEYLRSQSLKQTK